MKNMLLSKLMLGVLILSSYAGLMAQEVKGDKDYHPYSGQEGKDVVWVPTPQELVETMLNIAKVTGEDFLIDLGSGDGRTVITAAKRGAKARGLEYNPDMVALSRRNAVKEGVGDKTEFLEGDLFQADLTRATVITMFLLPEINLRLRPILLGLKPGTRIVSNTFQMDEWIPDSTARATEICTAWCDAYLWIVPAKVAGLWKTPQGILKLNQEFQRVAGIMDTGKKSMRISEGKLNGNLITFTINGQKYSGTVNGKTINGTCNSGNNINEWKADFME